jgi:hypothetical protein
MAANAPAMSTKARIFDFFIFIQSLFFEEQFLCFKQGSNKKALYVFGRYTSFKSSALIASSGWANLHQDCGTHLSFH